MRIFQSLWTKPALDKRWDQDNQLESNIWLYTLSVLYAKSIGLEIVLYTDSLGKALLNHLPYDAIYTTLNNIPDSIPTMVWAYGKFEALKNEPIGSIHIDGDVFLKKSDILKELDFSSYDVIVQNAEGMGWYYTDPKKQLIKYNIISEDFLNTNYAYNCGIVGFNNKELKNQYLNFYFDSINKVSTTRNLKTIMLSNKSFCIDLPLEQHSLAALCQNYKVKELLKGEDLHQKSLSIGYQHLIGKDKYSHIDRIKAYVLALDSTLYYKTKKVIEKYKKIIS